MQLRDRRRYQCARSPSARRARGVKPWPSPEMPLPWSTSTGRHIANVLSAAAGARRTSLFTLTKVQHQARFAARTSDPKYNPARARRLFELVFRADSRVRNTAIFGESNGEPTSADIERRGATSSRVRAAQTLIGPRSATPGHTHFVTGVKGSRVQIPPSLLVEAIFRLPVQRAGSQKGGPNSCGNGALNATC